MKQYNNSTSLIELCDLCQGSGARFFSEERHKTVESLLKEVCSFCEGSGRVIKMHKITYTPFKQEDYK